MMFVVAQPVHEEQMPCAAKTKEGDRKSAAFRWYEWYYTFSIIIAKDIKTSNKYISSSEMIVQIF